MVPRVEWGGTAGAGLHPSSGLLSPPRRQGQGERGLPRKVPTVSPAASEPGRLCQGDSVPLRFARGHCTRRGTGCAIAGWELLLQTPQACLCSGGCGVLVVGVPLAPPCPQGLTPPGPGCSLGTQCGEQPALGHGSLQRLSPGAATRLCQHPPPHAARPAPVTVGPIRTRALPAPSGCSCRHHTAPSLRHGQALREGAELSRLPPASPAVAACGWVAQPHQPHSTLGSSSELPHVGHSCPFPTDTAPGREHPLRLWVWAGAWQRGHVAIPAPCSAQRDGDLGNHLSYERALGD